MNMMKTVFLVFMTGFLFSCSSFPKNDPISDLKTLDFRGSHPSKNWIQEHHEDLEIVSLKYSRPESLVKDMRSLVRLQDRFVILDYDIAQNKDLKLFDLEGNFIKMVNELEFEFKKHEIETFALWNDNQILVLDKKNSAFILNSSLEIEKRVLLPFKAEKLVVDKDRCYFFTNKNAFDGQNDSTMYEYLVTDRNFNLLKKYRPFKIEPFTSRVTSSSDHDFTKSEFGVIHLRDSYDTIFNLTEKGLMPLVKLQFHNIYDPKLLGFEATYDDPRAVWLVANLFNTQDLIYLNYIQGEKFRVGVYDKKAEQLIVMKGEDLNKDYASVAMPRMHQDGRFYGWFTEEGSSYMTLNKSNENTLAGKIYKMIKLNTNPVIVSYRLKP